MAKVQGYCEDRFSSVRALLQANIDSGLELGASLSVQIDGKFVIDLWGGYAEEDKTREWQEDTVVNVWSSTKPVSSLAAYLLAERGLVKFDDRVSKYWPEYGVNGKEDVLVRHIISNTSGVPAWEQPVIMEDVYDVERANMRLAQQAPWWEPGTASGYHSIAHGHYISELVRRTTGKSLKEFIAEELAQPLKADFQLGLKHEDYPRAATIVAPPMVSQLPEPAPPFMKALGSPGSPATTANTKPWRDAELGATNGHGSGRAIAKILSPIVLGGTVNGVKFLSPKTIDQIFQEQAHGTDLVLGVKLRFGIGFGLPAADTHLDWLPTDGRVCLWGGWGGSLAIMDLDRRMSIGYAMNKMHDTIVGSVCSRAYVQEIYKVLGVESLTVST